MSTRSEFLSDLFSRRGNKPADGNSEWYVELHGGAVLEPTAFEPDAATHRNDYYYNAVTNILYKKIITRKYRGTIAAYWQKISN